MRHFDFLQRDCSGWFTLSPDQKGIETLQPGDLGGDLRFTLSPDQKGIETNTSVMYIMVFRSH